MESEHESSVKNEARTTAAAQFVGESPELFRSFAVLDNGEVTLYLYDWVSASQQCLIYEAANEQIGNVTISLVDTSGLTCPRTDEAIEESRRRIRAALSEQ